MTAMTSSAAVEPSMRSTTMPKTVPKEMMTTRIVTVSVAISHVNPGASSKEECRRSDSRECQQT